MTVLLQISDPHFGTERYEVVEALLALSRTLAPDVLVLSGDITQRARRSQFEGARSFVDRLGIATRIVLPGNHDLPVFDLFTRLVDPYGHYIRSFGESFAPSIETPDLLVLGVNTTTPRRRKDGEVGEVAIRRVADRLKRATYSQLRIVVTHQPAYVTRPKDAGNLLHGHQAAVRAWAAAGADIVMGGHIHLPYVAAINDGFPDLPRKLWCVQAGTALSRRLRHEANNSINVIRHDRRNAERCLVERWDYGEVSKSFERVTVHELELDREKPLVEA